MLSQFRQVLAPCRQALARPLVEARVPPNVLTLLAIPLAAGAAFLAHRGHGVESFCLALLTCLADFVDGEVARLQERVTPFGDLLDALVDRVTEGLLLIGLMAAFPVAAGSALLGSFLVSYIKARTGLVVSLDNRDWPGMGDRADRLVLLLLALLFSGSAWLVAGRPVTEMVLLLLVGVCVIACLQRTWHAWSLVAEDRGRPRP